MYPARKCIYHKGAGAWRCLYRCLQLCLCLVPGYRSISLQWPNLLLLLLLIELRLEHFLQYIHSERILLLLLNFPFAICGSRESVRERERRETKRTKTTQITINYTRRNYKTFVGKFRLVACACVFLFFSSIFFFIYSPLCTHTIFKYLSHSKHHHDKTELARLTTTGNS